MGLVPKLNQVVATGTAATLLPSSQPSHNVVQVIVTSSAAAFLGDSTVTTAKGIPLSTTPLILPIATQGSSGYDLAQLYVVASTTANVNVLYFVRV
jgi:hypothetical protein